ncbi:MAG: hypothetical protein AB7P33_12970, partial [Dehalococcoidia bacterium]
MHLLAVMLGGKNAPLRTRIAPLRVIAPVTATVVALLAASLSVPAKASADEPLPGLIGNVVETTASVTNTTTELLA